MFIAYLNINCYLSYLLGSLDEAASTTGSLLTINGKNLAVKRIRSAYKQSNDTAVRDKSSCESKLIIVNI